MCWLENITSHFSSRGCPHNWVPTFSGFCLSRMNNAAVDFPLRHVDVFTTTQKSLRYSGEGWCSIQQQDVTCEFCSQHIALVSVLITKKSHLRWCLQYASTWNHFFILRYWFSFIRLLHVMLEMSSTHPLVCCESSGGSPAVFSPGVICTFSRVLRGHCRRNSGVQCTSESRYTFINCTTSKKLHWSYISAFPYCFTVFLYIWRQFPEQVYGSL